MKYFLVFPCISCQFCEFKPDTFDNPSEIKCTAGAVECQSGEFEDSDINFYMCPKWREKE